MGAEADAARIPGGGAMGERVRAFDWSATSFGPIKGWPACQCTLASQVLAAPFASVLLWGSELTVVAYNDAYGLFLGSKPEALGRPILEVWAEVREALAPQFERVLAGETISIRDARFLLLRGGEPEEAWFDYGFSPVYDETGQVAGMLHTGVETTARVQADAALRESEGRWRAVFDNMDEGLQINEMILGLDGRAVDLRYLDVNAAWERHSGFPRSMVVGRRVTEVFPSAETSFWIDLLGRVADTGQTVRLERYFAPAAKWFEVIAYRAGPQRAALLMRNVTRRREALERQRAALETGLVGFFEWDVTAGTISGDERFARFYGLDPAVAAAGVARTSLIGAIHPADRAVVQANVDAALASGGDVANEFRVMQADGGLRWLLVRSRCTVREGSRPLRYTGTAVDVTSTRAAEAALRESEARLRAALDGGGLGTFDWDLRADTLRLSERAGEIFGFGPGEGQRLADYFSRILPEDHERVRAAAAAGLAQEQMETNYRIRLPDGTVRYVTSHGRVLRDVNGSPERVVGVFRDETERERTAEALRESEARLQLALDASGMVGIFDWRVPEDRLIADARFARLFGVDPDRAAAGAPIAEFARVIHPDDWPHVEAALHRAMKMGEHYEAEYRVRQPHGGERWVAARGRVFLDAAGAPLRFSGTAVDVTERRRAEERQSLLSREVDHRAKNALAVVQAALRLTRAPDLPSYIRVIEGRVAALARAQTLLAKDRWAGADLRTLLHGELAGFLGTGGGSGQQAVVEGPKVALPPGAAQPFAMAIHELATNAVKYGALSAPGGRVVVTWTLEGGAAGRLRLRWAERGGPPVEGPPSQPGFGTRVLDGTVRGQLGGTVALSWNVAGLVCDIEVPLGRNPSMAMEVGDTKRAGN